MKKSSLGPNRWCLAAVAVLAAVALCPGAADAAGWQPTFDDRPVSASDRAKIAAAIPASAIADPRAPRRILVYSATAGFRHKSIPYGKIALSLMGEMTGSYEAIVSDDPANFEPAAVATFDAVVLLNPTLDFFLPPADEFAAKPEPQRAALRERHARLTQSLVDYVRKGGGLVGIHAAADACYQQPAYGALIGAVFDGHPWKSASRVTVVVADPGHALNAPVFDEDSFELTEEIYQFKADPDSREKLRILLRLDPDRSDAVEGINRGDGGYPVAWVQSVGRGRVFYTSLGHNPHIFQNPTLLRHFLAGIQFAVGDLPADTTPSQR